MHASTNIRLAVQLIVLKVTLFLFSVAYSVHQELQETLARLGFAEHNDVAKMMAVSPSS